jgi:hypothetical protein
MFASLPAPEAGHHCSATAPTADSLRFDPVWRTSTVLSLVNEITHESNFDALPILADALEDAGCDNATLLGHCRHGTNHTKGCWVFRVVNPSVPIPTAQLPKPPSLLMDAKELLGESQATVRERTVISIMLPSFFVGALLGLAIGWEIVQREPPKEPRIGFNPIRDAFLAFGACMVLVPLLALYTFLGCRILPALWRRRFRRAD